LGTAAALVGLLFVAVSIEPQSIIKRGAPPERQVVAASAYTALVNAFFISLAGAAPGLPFGNAVAAASIASLLATLSQCRKLWPRHPDARRLVRRMAWSMLALIAYGLELGFALQFDRASQQSTALGGLIYMLVAAYAIGISRSWELLGAQRAGLIHNWLSPLADVDEDGEPDQTA
jgi:hypothetical protein